MKILYYNSKEEGSKKASNIIIDNLKSNPKIVLGLATGSTPETLYKYIIEDSQKENLSFKNVVSFNLDEYVGLNESDEDQSYKFFMDNHLFKYIDINKNNTHFPIDFRDKEIKENYDEYDNLIKKSGGIDIQILGIGNNGHIAFNEPGSDINSKTRLINLTESTIKANSRFFTSISDVPKQAVSMGLGTINKSKKIILLAFGEAKREALERLIDAKSFDINWPCTSLFNHNDLTIITDIKL